MVLWQFNLYHQSVVKSKASLEKDSTCDVRYLEKYLFSITVWHHKVFSMLLNNESKGLDFLSASHT